MHRMATTTPNPTFRRATREDAIELARERFLAGDRLEMSQLAAELGVGRTTLYRWVGEREQLVGEVFGSLVDRWLEQVEPEIPAEPGIDRFLRVLRAFLEFAAASEPLTTFTQREPTLAMRALMDPAGPVTRHAIAALRGLLDEVDPDVEISDEIANAMSMVTRTLVWANIATGQEPDVEGAVSLAETLIRASGVES